MKGIVFTELFDMLESAHGADFVDDLIDNCDLPSGGAYTAVGTYDYSEMGALLHELSSMSGHSVSALMELFGEHLFGRFYALYPNFFEGISTPIDFLVDVEKVIHKEVLKLYPDAELPKFTVLQKSADSLDMAYRSSRGLAHLALGLIRGCMAHYGGQGEVSMQSVTPNGKEAVFCIRMGA
ncbi:heme NO-binding domain-containing protein [Limnobacter sp.]|uniref:heme NO-binding domain-containing protein n=1 Tax=Limnobacter sp. TaxID=2003368 RepID=UPI00351240ED